MSNYGTNNGANDTRQPVRTFSRRGVQGGASTSTPTSAAAPVHAASLSSSSSNAQLNALVHQSDASGNQQVAIAPAAGQQRRQRRGFFSRLCCCMSDDGGASKSSAPWSHASNSSSNPLLGDRWPSDAGKKLLVLDLDETLVHSSFKPVAHCDYVIPVEIDGVVHRVYVLKVSTNYKFAMQREPRFCLRPVRTCAIDAYPAATHLFSPPTRNTYLWSPD